MKTDGGKVRYHPRRRIEEKRDIVFVDSNSAPTSGDKICGGSKRSVSGAERKEGKGEDGMEDRLRVGEGVWVAFAGLDGPYRSRETRL